MCVYCSYFSFPSLLVRVAFSLSCLFVSLLLPQVVTAQRLGREYNEGLDEARQKVIAHNAEMEAELEKVGASRATIQRCLLPEPQKCPALDGRWCRRFLELMRRRRSPVNTAGTYLEWSDARVVSSRKKLHEHIRSGVHRYLILNTDQVWRTSLRPGKSVYMKEKNRSLVVLAVCFFLFGFFYFHWPLKHPLVTSWRYPM